MMLTQNDTFETINEINRIAEQFRNLPVEDLGQEEIGILKGIVFMLKLQHYARELEPHWQKVIEQALVSDYPQTANEIISY